MTDVRWIEEKLYTELLPLGYAQRFEASQVFVETQTDFQNLIIFENPTFGRIMFLDGICQTTEADEYVYHEMLTHVPMIAHGDVRSVLIIGGGDGGILREVLRHPVDRAVMVEIDGQVVDACKEYLPSLSAGAFDDPRTELLIDDGIRYVRDCADNTFDVVIVDSTDPIGPGEVLFTDEFYQNARRILKPGGLVVTQNGVPFFQTDELKTTMKRLGPIFKDVTFYGAVVPTYIGGFMTLAWGSDNEGLRQVPLAEIEARFAKLGFQGRYYAPDVHQAAFALPTFIARHIG